MFIRCRTEQIESLTLRVLVLIARPSLGSLILLLVPLVVVPTVRPSLVPWFGLPLVGPGSSPPGFLEVFGPWFVACWFWLLDPRVFAEVSCT